MAIAAAGFIAGEGVAPGMPAGPVAGVPLGAVANWAVCGCAPAGEAAAEAIAVGVSVAEGDSG